MKTKKCIICKKEFEPNGNRQVYCKKIECQKSKSIAIKERVRKYGSQWYWKNREKILKKEKLYRENNPDYYRKLNKKAINRYNHSPKGIYNALKKNCNSQNKPDKLKITQENFIKWYKTQEKKCIYCNIPEKLIYLLKEKTSYPITRLTIDRKNNDLSYQKDNIVLACSRCNTLKRNFFSFKEMQEIAQKYIKPKWKKLI